VYFLKIVLIIFEIGLYYLSALPKRYHIKVSFRPGSELRWTNPDVFR